MSRNKCLRCGKEFNDTRLVQNMDEARMCPECYAIYSTCADIMCLNCGAYVGKVPSGKQPNGYEVKPKELLHVTNCPNCSKSPSGVVVELEEWENKK